jgi:hypothetical protein
MSTIVTRAGKGSPLTHNEVDANFTNLNTDKAELASPTFTGTVVLPSSTSIGNVSATEIGYLDGVTSAIQTQLNAKADLSGPTFTGTVVLPSSTSIGNVSSTEIGYLDGVTSAIQTQLNAKGAGTVTTVSVVSANGFAGTVANATTTPAITLSTSITGILKGNGTAISAATSGTDYAPATSGTFILSGNGAGAFTNVTIGTGLDFTGGTLSATGGGGGSGTVTSVDMSVPTGLAIGGNPITTSGTLALTYASGYAIPTTAKQTEWDTAYTDRNKWDGGATDLIASTGRTSLGLGTIATLAAPSGTVVGTSDTQTLTNKRITPRISTTTSSATPTINTDNVDFYGLTAQAADITSFTTNLSGTPTDGQKLWIYIVGTAARAITWGASFEASTAALPTTTVSTDRLDVGFVWNAATSKWRCVAVA